MSKEPVETYAYRKGRKAGQQCGSNSHLEPLNPYPSNSIDFLEWEDGYFDGQNQAQSMKFSQSTHLDHIGCFCSGNKFKERFLT